MLCCGIEKNVIGAAESIFCFWCCELLQNKISKTSLFNDTLTLLSPQRNNKLGVSPICSFTKPMLACDGAKYTTVPTAAAPSYLPMGHAPRISIAPSMGRARPTKPAHAIHHGPAASVPCSTSRIRTMPRRHTLRPRVLAVGA